MKESGVRVRRGRLKISGVKPLLTSEKNIVKKVQVSVLGVRVRRGMVRQVSKNKSDLKNTYIFK